MSVAWLDVSVTYALNLAPLGYYHRDVLRMTPRHARRLWLAIPDPELAPKESDDPAELLGLSF